MADQDVPGVRADAHYEDFGTPSLTERLGNIGARESTSSPAVVWLGVLLCGLGVLAIVFPFFSTLAATVFLGGLFLAAGILKIINAFMTHPIVWRGVLKALWGFVYAVAGAWLLYAPIAGAWSLTFVLASLFVAGGVMSIVWALLPPRPAGSVWMVLSGAIGIVLGALVAALLPVSALWFPGVVAGVDLISTGVAFLAMDRATRSELAHANLAS